MQLLINFTQILLTTQITPVLFLGTIGMILLATSIILFAIFHQRRVMRFQQRIQQMEVEHQKMLLKASIKLQEEERTRLAADLHDDAGPLLATAKLYLNDNFVNLDKTAQMHSLFNAKQIIDDTIQLIRNISHSLMPPTLKNFGLSSAVNDFFQKISNSGSLNASSKFHDYKTRLKSDKELILFRVIQELVNNVLKHSKASFIHLTQHDVEEKVILRLHHDGFGLTQEEFLRYTNEKEGLGLKNIQSRLRVIHGDILYEKDSSQSLYKVTIEIPREEGEEIK
ncbi:MAG TPA: histidine kinase [Chitinophagaceae bacterium]|nr:two-component sensor histidine kinase [Chitinophagaceae bacterium]MCC6635594.1 two-component sensor histidine kinase [Chitinophagaceae bacterium]HMZ46303.1 histidine kinase [Chitinophagaceae bacterium]HNF28760.1 histidine kinase [Chitinophagaceae bacterium]HNJ58490.1 histidine kinase [Chitinophagaceae bacterium]